MPGQRLVDVASPQPSPKKRSAVDEIDDFLRDFDDASVGTDSDEASF